MDSPSDLDRLAYELERALLSLDRLAVRRLLSESSLSASPVQIVEMLVAPVLERIGVGWQQGRIALSQVYMSGCICEEMVDSILPPAHPNRKSQPRMAIAVLEDHHRLGKRMVYSTLRAAGFELLDYGHGLSVDSLANRVVDDGVRILLISTLMLRSALRVRDLRSKLDELHSDVRIVVGGAPFLFDGQLWQEVGADAMGRSASEAVGLVTRITGQIS